MVKNLLAELVLTYAFQSNNPISLGDRSNIFRDYGVRVELSDKLNYGFYYNLSPYIWRSKEENQVGSGGAILILGLEKGRFAIQYYHNSEHRFDGFTGPPLNVDMIELKVKLN